MLVLSRKKDQKVCVNVGGVRIDVTVVQIAGDKVRLGFIAPSEVTIHREEVQERIDSGEPDRRKEGK